MENQKEVGLLNTTRNIGIGLLLGGCIGLGIALSKTNQKYILNRQFHASPAVQSVDSIYQSQTNAYQLQLDSLRKVYNNHLE